MILWGAIDLLMHFVGKRNGIPVKGARPALFIFLVGSLAAVITTIVVGDGHAWEETGPNLSKYVGGDQYFWPSWAFALISWLVNLARNNYSNTNNNESGSPMLPSASSSACKAPTWHI